MQLDQVELIHTDARKRSLDLGFGGRHPHLFSDASRLDVDLRRPKQIARHRMLSGYLPCGFLRSAVDRRRIEDFTATSDKRVEYSP